MDLEDLKKAAEDRNFRQWQLEMAFQSLIMMVKMAYFYPLEQRKQKDA